MQGERHSLSEGVIYKLYKEHPCVQSIRALGFCGQSVIVVQERAVHMPIVAPRARASPAQEGVRTRARTGREGCREGPTARTGVTRTLPCFVGGEAVSESSAIERRDLAGLSRRDARSRRERAEHCLFDRKKKSLDSSPDRPLSLRWAWPEDGRPLERRTGNAEPGEPHWRSQLRAPIQAVPPVRERQRRKGATRHWTFEMG